MLKKTRERTKELSRYIFVFVLYVYMIIESLRTSFEVYGIGNSLKKMTGLAKDSALEKLSFNKKPVLIKILLHLAIQRKSREIISKACFLIVCKPFSEHLLSNLKVNTIKVLLIYIFNAFSAGGLGITSPKIENYSTTYMAVTFLPSTLPT